MHVSIWEQGTREEVIARLNACTDDTIAPFRAAMVAHLEAQAQPGSPCTVSLSGSATYIKKSASAAGLPSARLPSAG